VGRHVEYAALLEGDAVGAESWRRRVSGGVNQSDDKKRTMEEKQSKRRQE
jgi:hypothetical protein